ncbi:MAG: hypothetical protein HYV59_03235 [Planctomycetes bacterium]|nr:hypothetical protein [Planctomycetota bacterium]
MTEPDTSDDVCVYCGSTKALTDDHIPPKTLFPKPRPSNLITVRSCRACNEGASKDDEYFRLMISMRHDTGDHPAVKKILPTIYRSLQKPTKKGFQQALFNSMGDLDIVSGGNIYLGTAPGYDVDLRRLDRVAARITAGLYFYEFGNRVPGNLHVTAYSTSGLDNVNSDAKARVFNIFNKVTRNQPRVFGENVFAYWFQQVQGHDTMSAWVLAFYERVEFLCLVTPNEDVI